MNPSANQGLATGRIHGLDALRAAAMLLGIVLHAARAYGFENRWCLNETDRHLGFDVLSYWIHVFRMPLFFLIAGFFAHMLYEREGAWRFVKLRWLRVGLPLTLGLVSLVPAVRFITELQEHGSLGSALSVHTVRDLLLSSPNYHLWFLEALVWFYLLTLLWQGLRLVLPSGGSGCGKRVVSAWRKILTGPWQVVALVALSTVAALVRYDVAGCSRLLPEEVPAEWLHYLLFYVVGWSFYAHREALQTCADRLNLNVCGMALVGAAGTIMHYLTEVHGPWLIGIRVMLDLALAWFAILTSLGACLRFLSNPRPVVRYASDASYWMYLVHLPIVLVLQGWLVEVSWPAWVKFSFVLGVTTTLVFVTYELLVRHTVVGLVLHGPRPVRTPAAALAVQPAR